MSKDCEKQKNSNLFNFGFSFLSFILTCFIPPFPSPFSTLTLSFCPYAHQSIPLSPPSLPHGPNPFFTSLLLSTFPYFLNSSLLSLSLSVLRETPPVSLLVQTPGEEKDSMNNNLLQHVISMGKKGREGKVDDREKGNKKEWMDWWRESSWCLELQWDQPGGVLIRKWFSSSLGTFLLFLLLLLLSLSPILLFYHLFSLTPSLLYASTLLSFNSRRIHTFTSLYPSVFFTQALTPGIINGNLNEMVSFIWVRSVFITAAINLKIRSGATCLAWLIGTTSIAILTLAVNL